MTKKLWNVLVNNLDKMVRIETTSKTFYLDGTYSELETNFKFIVNGENLTIKWISPRVIDEDAWLNRGVIEYVSIPHEVTYNRVDVTSFKWRVK